MPRLVVVAGVNGCGKSTLTQQNRFNNLRIIDPDAIAKSLSTRTDDSARARAGREALLLRQKYLDEGDSFILETTLSGHGTARLMQAARKRRYQIELHYVYLIDVQQSVDRVETRVSRGGHAIPHEDILRRFPRSREQFARAALLSDVVIAYDNASYEQPFEPVLAASETGFEIDPLAPEWLVASVERIRSELEAREHASSTQWS